MSAVLEVQGLQAQLTRRGQRAAILRGVDLRVAQGEVVGLIGESGSGKSVTGMALLRLLPDAIAVSAASIRFQGQEISALGDAEFARLRGRQLGMIFQNPTGAFNPAKTIGWHLREVLARTGAAKDWQARATALLAQVGISDGARVLALHPHRLSGGMLQRALIALVLAYEPALVIADEPTTNLDNIVEQQILALIGALRDRIGAGFIFITHDIAVAGRLCDRIAVMYAGEIVEEGPAAALLAAPLHPYTQGLFDAAMALERGAEELAEIPGELPPLFGRGEGCLFAPRCPQARPACTAARPAMTEQGAGRRVRCILHAEGAAA